MHSNRPNNKNQKTNSAQSELDAVFNLIDQKKYEDALKKLDTCSDKAFDRWIVAKGVCLHELGRFDEEIAVYQKMINWKKRSKALVPISRCYALQGDHEKELETLLLLPSIDKDPHGLNALAICYYDLGKYTDSINTAKKLLQCEAEPHKRAYWNKCAYSITARGKEAQGLLKEAIDTMLKISDWKNDNNCIVTLGRCYQTDKQYQKAIDTFTLVHDWMRNQKAATAVAYCYGAMGEAQKAIEIFKKISGDNNEAILLGLGREMVKMGQHDEALIFYKRVPGWEKSRSTLITIGCCYEDKNDIKTALEYFNKARQRWPKDKAAILGAVRCLQAQGEIQEGHELLLSIPKQETDSTVLFAFGVSFRLLGDFETSITTFHKIHNWQTDKKALLCISMTLEEAGRYQEAIDTVKSISHWE